MNRSDIEIKITKLKLEHKKITNKRKKNKSDLIEAELFFKHKAILKEITDLEWELKSSKEKNDYRKAVLNMGLKWSNMEGSKAEEEEQDTSFSLVITLCDVALELLDKNSLEDELKEKLQDLVVYLDAKRTI